jgi:hypothetical protein
MWINCRKIFQYIKPRQAISELLYVGMLWTDLRCLIRKIQVDKILSALLMAFTPILFRLLCSTHLSSLNRLLMHFCT